MFTHYFSRSGDQGHRDAINNEKGDDVLLGDRLCWIKRVSRQDDRRIRPMSKM
jgi:hypothetical protein